jgi:general secretion pathway protein M
VSRRSVWSGSRRSNDLLRLTLSGDAMTLLPWLDRIERDGIALQSLTLEKRDVVLEARMVLR